MKKIYFAAPLFNEMELKRNEYYTEILEILGYEVYLPQREAGLSAKILKCRSKDKLIINTINIINKLGNKKYKMSLDMIFNLLCAIMISNISPIYSLLINKNEKYKTER